MVEVANRAADAAWRIRHLDDYDGRLEQAAQRVDELSSEHDTAALVIYEAALAKGGRPLEEVRETVRRFAGTFEDEEDPLTIPRTSGIMNTQDDSWFFGDENLRVLTGRLLGQFQHRVAQYNYIDEREVLKRWADGYDTRLFIRRRILETEPVVGVVGEFDLWLFQYLRLIAGGNTLVPSENVAGVLEALGYDEDADQYDVLARAEELALYLELPAPLVGEMLEQLGREGQTEFPEPPREAPEPEEPAEDAAPASDASDGVAESRDETVREDAGAEPTRVQDPQAKDAPGVGEEPGGEKAPKAPEEGRGGAAGASDREPGS